MATLLINLSEDTENYYVRAELPGVKGDDLDIKADGRSISLSGERKIEIEGNGVKYHRREREAGKFARMVSLPGEIDSEKVGASLKDGLLISTSEVCDLDSIQGMSALRRFPPARYDLRVNAFIQVTSPAILEWFFAFDQQRYFDFH